MGELISCTRPDGGKLKGYLVEPANGGAAPGLVVIQEWWGLNDQIKGVAQRLAAAGYRVLVPDLYRGKLALEANEAEHLMNGLDFADAAGQDVRAAVQHLKTGGSDKVGVTGFCMGGALTVLSLMLVPELDAGVIWYGYPPLEFVDAGKIKAPVMAHWASEDEVFPIDGADTLGGRFTEAGVSHTFYKYRAKHAFANENADASKLSFTQYDRQAADIAWERTQAFFQKHLS